MVSAFFVCFLMYVMNSSAFTLWLMGEEVRRRTVSVVVSVGPGLWAGFGSDGVVLF